MKTRLTRLFGNGALLALPILCACGGDAENREERTNRFETPTEAAVAPTLDPASAGSVAGKVNFLGTPPVRKKITFSEPVCQKPWGTQEALEEEVVVNPNSTLRNCLVYVNFAGKFPPPKEPVEIDQIGCVYRPHVLGMQASQPLKFKSSDETLHNIHWIGKNNPEDNFGMPKPGEKTRTFKFAEVAVKVKCDVHPWMGGWVGVFDHPFFAVTGDEGTFSIKNVPAGTHVLRLWHEKYGTQETNITVNSGVETTAEFAVQG